MLNNWFCLNHRAILKEREECEYKLNRYIESKESYLEYIKYEMNLLRRVEERRNVSLHISNNALF